MPLKIITFHPCDGLFAINLSAFPLNARKKYSTAFLEKFDISSATFIFFPDVAQLK